MKTLFLPLVAAFVTSACSGPTQYERGAYSTPVRAPAFDPATDAPHTTGQPGYVNGQRVDRSPNRRYAEPSRDPAMMAADGDARRAVELMFSEPVPKETPPGIARDEYVQCWKDFIRLMNNERDAILAFSPEEVRCLRNRVLAHCGARKVHKRAGGTSSFEYEDYMAGVDNARTCGKRHQFWTARVTKHMVHMEELGDEVYGWK